MANEPPKATAAALSTIAVCPISTKLSAAGVAWGHDSSLPTGHSSLTLATDDGRFASVVTNTNQLPTGPSANAAL
ncbi:hypothetical protein ACIA2T_04700 [Amycolatopsis japonica]|uniref:hypothetical protein n=1 Tax=Amycolatopsis japonica TaxID=208439 RepID=UPI0037A7BB43